MASTLRAFHIFICVDVFFDGKRTGGNATFVRAGMDITCKYFVADYIQTKALGYYQLIA
jgi:hypothetical protein